MSQIPNSRIPGVSATQPPAASRSVANVVVWRPFCVFSLTSEVRSPRPGSTALRRLDFPTPEGPETTLTPSDSAARSSSTPCPDFALVSRTG